jgi:hypothetical protein
MRTGVRKNHGGVGPVTQTLDGQNLKSYMQQQGMEMSKKSDG